MTTRLLAAIITITLALIFYTVGVWMEHAKKQLKPIHLALFVIGLVCDSTGTAIMSTLADHSNKGMVLSAHGVTGAIAIVLMFIHAVWALIVLLKKDEKAQMNFHKFSLLVWGVWLIPYLLGMVRGMK